jgi:YHS domain-containing protein
VITKRSLLTAAFAMAVVALQGLPVLAQNAPKPTRIALQGYDPMSYFESDEPKKGSPDFSVTSDGTIYLFTSAAHRDMFSSDPAHYAPRYAGYCAFTVSGGERIEADPRNWMILDEKLYVFRFPRDVKLFTRKATQLIQRADQRWETLKKLP